MSKLSITLGGDSQFLGGHTRFEVRNGKMELLGSWDRYSASDIELEPGLYQVSAVLSDGRNHEKLIQLTDQGAKVEFSDRRDELTQRRQDLPELDMDLSMQPVFDIGQRFKAPLEPFRDLSVQAEPYASEEDVSLANVVNASYRRVSPHKWIFEPMGEPQIPRADFEVGDSAFSISLPTNPRGNFPLNACTTIFRERNRRWQSDTWIAPERTVANTLQHWLRNGRISQARSLADDATELLLHKYSDPTGALLGALVLFRFGILEQRRPWLDNLTRDFSWLTDASILKLAIQARECGADPELAEQALSLARRPVLFTESYSILIDLLRRWPAAENAEPAFAAQCSAALEDLALRTVNVDWSATVLTVHSEIQQEEAAAYATP